MTASLRSFLSTLAGILNTSQDALYERQRVLLREGLLRAAPGPRRKRGVPATMDSIVVLLTGVLASMSLTDAGPPTRAVLAAKASDGEGATRPCPLTKAATFQEAMALILSKPALAEKVVGVSVTGTYSSAQIEFYKGSKVEVSKFAGVLTATPGAVLFTLSLNGWGIREIAKAFKSHESDDAKE